MDTVRIGVFLGELYGISSVHVTSEMPIYTGKTKEKVYITSGPEFEESLHDKILTIDKSLYGLKTSAAVFHGHLSESLLRLGLKKTENDSDSWML
jgi:hypothetical protein